MYLCARMKNTFHIIHYMNHQELLQQGVWLVDFWAEWCSACSAQDKIYMEIAEMFKDKINIGKINVSDNRVLSNTYGVQNIPFLIILKNGKIISRMPGIQSKEYLISQIKKLIE